MRFTPRHPNFVAEVNEIDLSVRLHDDEIHQIHTGLDHFSVLIFRDQAIDGEAHVAFSKQLGPLQPAIGNNITKLTDRRLGADFSDVSNLNRAGVILPRNDRARLFGMGNRLWHSDASFRAVPAKYSLLLAYSVALSGGNTEFADMRAAFDALNDTVKCRVRNLVAEQSQLHSRSLLGFTEFTEEERKACAPVFHTMVRLNDRTGREALYVGSHSGAIVGWPTPEARTFIFDLVEHATQRQFVHAHKWRAGDLVIWDNRQVIHRVRPYDDLSERRDMRRTTIMGDGPTVDQASYVGSADAWATPRN